MLVYYFGFRPLKKPEYPYSDYFSDKDTSSVGPKRAISLVSLISIDLCLHTVFYKADKIAEFEIFTK